MDNYSLVLSGNHSEFVKLRVGQKDCKSLDDIQLKRESVKVISRAFTYSQPNTETSEQIIEAQSLELFNCIRKGFNELTISEVQHAVKSGLDGIYGAYFGMCGKTYHQFLKGFRDNPERGRQWLKYLESLDGVKTSDVPQHIKVAKNKETLHRVFIKYKKDGETPIVPWMVYDKIKEYKGLKSLVDKATYKRIYDEIAPSWEKMLKNERDKQERAGNLSSAQDLMDIIMNGMVKHKGFETVMKTRLLKEYFNSIDILEV